MTLITLLVKASLVLACAALVQLVLARRLSAATRHLVWTLAILGVVVLPLVALAVPEWAPVERTVPVGMQPAFVVGDSLAPWPIAAVPPAAPAGDVHLPWTLLLALVYAAGVVLLLTRLVLQHVWTRRIVRAATAVDDGRWLALLDECAAGLGIRRHVRLLRSEGDLMPMASGMRDGEIVIPASADEWPDDRRRAVLLHELAHIDRQDCLTQSLAAVACAMYWMHPGVWWIAARLRAERELACDDRVLATGEDARAYAGHLLELAYTLGGSPAPAVAVTMARTRELEGRMLAALDEARNRTMPPRGSRLAGLALLSLITVPVAAATMTPRVHVIDRADLSWSALRPSAQNPTAAPQPRPRFEVVSIKRTPETTGPGADFTTAAGGRLIARNNAVMNFITNSYGVPNYLVVGGPDWVRQERYDMEARADGDQPRGQMMLMLQTLLEERFQLRVHRETREVPAYVLTVARGGAKLTPAGSNCIEPGSTKPVPPPAAGALVSNRCGNNRVTTVTPPNTSWQGVSIDMRQVASTLAGYFRRPVVDRTGLTGFFDIQIDLPPLQPAAAAEAGVLDSGPSVFTVLQEQLGLRVEEGRGPAEVLVIDEIERPTGN